MGFPRRLTLPKKTFLLFGPRGTGKSTLLKKTFPQAYYIDLLESDTYLRLSAEPSYLEEMVENCRAGHWIVLDEVQRVPDLLNEVHRLYEKRRLQFALSGSSARKLKRGNANLLGGRALTAHLFPLVSAELKSSGWTTSQCLTMGSLPIAVNEPAEAERTLRSYVETYLREELFQEGLIRKLEPFSRFLRVAGVFNGQILNITNVASEARVGRTSVDQYFQILEDTLLGVRLPSYLPGHSVREVSHPRFYWFDAGVARAASGLSVEDVDSIWLGTALETLLLHEVRAYNVYAERLRGLYYYSISGGGDIDLVVETRPKSMSRNAEVVLIEIKASKRWDDRWFESARALASSGKVEVKSIYGIYQGTRAETRGKCQVLSVDEFLTRLWAGKIY